MEEPQLCLKEVEKPWGEREEHWNSCRQIWLTTTAQEGALVQGEAEEVSGARQCSGIWTFV